MRQSSTYGFGMAYAFVRQQHTRSSHDRFHIACCRHQFTLYSDGKGADTFALPMMKSHG